MRYIIAIAALITAPLPALAQAPATVAVGQTLRGPADSRLGQIDRVFADGSVRVILDGKLVVVPANTISVTDGKPVTTLSRREIAHN
ncbi:MAG: hypothetical protein JWR80_8806 [Bradyrhizobium sp.]|nr:hypothetical protein [Bradyrhizobium sp.]